jgi:hypothetical protein
VFGELHGAIPIGCQAGQQLGQRFELLARQHPEELVIDRALQGRKADQPVHAVLGQRQLHPPAVVRMGALLDQSVGNQLVDLVGDEGAAQIQSLGDLIDPHRFFRRGILDGDQDQILGRRQADKSRERLTGGFQAAAEGEIIVEEAAQRAVVSIPVEQLGL